MCYSKLKKSYQLFSHSDKINLSVLDLYHSILSTPNVASDLEKKKNNLYSLLTYDILCIYGLMIVRIDNLHILKFNDSKILQQLKNSFIIVQTLTLVFIWFVTLREACVGRRIRMGPLLGCSVSWEANKACRSRVGCLVRLIFFRLVFGLLFVVYLVVLVYGWTVRAVSFEYGMYLGLNQWLVKKTWMLWFFSQMYELW